MLGLISWRNVWRSRGRTLVVMFATILGIWAITVSTSYVRTFTVDYVNNAIKEQYSHIQIHYPDFRTNQDLQLAIKDGELIASRIRQKDEVEGVSARTILNGMIATAKSTGGAQIYGVDPAQDAKVFDIRNSIIEGEYLNGVRGLPVVIGKELAEKFNAGVKSKIVLTFTDMQNNLLYGEFRVSGIFDVNSPVLDQAAVFVKKKDLESMLGDQELTHQVAIRLKDQEQVETIATSLASEYPELEVNDWKKLAPELELLVNQSMTGLYFLMSIILLAMMFGIVNTMLMAVLERVKELGMLMAVGMNRVRIFLMIILETIMVAGIGGPAGFLLGYATIQYYRINGLDLSMYSEGLEEFGYDAIIYPDLEYYYYLIIAAGIVVTAVIASIYPAMKAVRLRPAEALHKI